MDLGLLDQLKERISIRSGLICKVSPCMQNPKYAFDEERCQYNSKLILKYLIKSCPRDTLRLIGVTNVDLYVPILKYVYGLSIMEGQCSVISLYRLRPQFYNHPSNTSLLISRLEKVALHELGHSFGLIHCPDRRCVMYSSTRIEDTDYKQSDFCPTCSDLFNWLIKKCIK